MRSSITAPYNSRVFFLPRFSATYHEYQRISDPLHILPPLQQQQSDLIRLQNNIRQSPKMVTFGQSSVNIIYIKIAMTMP